MFKFIFVLLIIIFVVATIPKVRNHVVPPILDRLGPVGVKLAAPMKKWESQAECDRLLRELRQQVAQGRPMVTPADFYAWSRRIPVHPSSGKDPWGERYWLKPGQNVTSCGSNGPDLQRNTPDDIIVTTPWS